MRITAVKPAVKMTQRTRFSTIVAERPWSSGGAGASADHTGVATVTISLGKDASDRSLTLSATAAEAREMAATLLDRAAAAEKLAAERSKRRCEECGTELNPYTDPNTGKDGLSCDTCGWSWDEEAGS